MLGGHHIFSLRIEMQNMPANLIRPKTPPSASAFFLKSIAHHARCGSALKILAQRSPLRNIFPLLKKRMIMMILGIAGCTALVLTGFGIHDSVANIANFQFDDIQNTMSAPSSPIR